MGQQSFILHLDSLNVLDELTDEQAGKLFKIIKKFQTDKDVCIPDFGLRIAFLPFKNQFIRDKEKYEQFIEKQFINGKKGGRPKTKKTTNENPNKPSLSLVNQETQAFLEKPKKAYNKNVSDSVSDSVSVNKNERESKNTHTQFFDFSFYKTNYNDLPDEIKQSTESSLWRLWQQFNTHIDEKCENLRLISQQMNFLEYLEYRQAFIKSGKISVPMCLKIISDLNNHKPASEKYVSVYPALVKWTEQQISFKD